MPTARLSKRTADAASASDRPYMLYDEALTGFALRVMPSGVKTWQVEYRAGSGRGVAKKRMSLGSVTVVTADQARSRAAEILARARLGSDPVAERTKSRAVPTVAEFAERFLAEYVATKTKPKTAEAYRHQVRKMLVPALGSKKLDKVTRADMLRLHQQISVDRPIAANRLLQMVGSMWSYAGECEIVEEGTNPARGVTRNREQKSERYLTGDELARLGAALREAETDGIPWEPNPSGKVKHAPRAENRRVTLGPHAVAAIRLLIFTGARLREVLHARWSEYDAERGCLFLADSKTGRKTIVLNAAAVAVLEALPRVGSYIIAGEDLDKPRHDLNRPWQTVRRRAGLEDVRLHDLRHSFASVGVGASWGLPIVGRLLGHASTVTTQRYAHLEQDPLRRASNRIAEQIAAAMDGKPAGDVVPLDRRAAND